MVLDYLSLAIYTFEVHMLDYKQLFGLSAILFGLGFFIKSVTVAHAIPSGPIVSLGVNPIQSWGGEC